MICLRRIREFLVRPALAASLVLITSGISSPSTAADDVPKMIEGIAWSNAALPSGRFRLETGTVGTCLAMAVSAPCPLRESHASLTFPTLAGTRRFAFSSVRIFDWGGSTLYTFVGREISREPWLGGQRAIFDLEIPHRRPDRWRGELLIPELGHEIVVRPATEQ